MSNPVTFPGNEIDEAGMRNLNRALEQGRSPEQTLEAFRRYTYAAFEHLMHEAELQH